MDSAPMTGHVSPSSGKIVPEHRANLGTLRSHGLVSNSIFKSAASPTSSQPATPLGRGSPNHAGGSNSPAARSAAQQRFGFGLGISANGSFSPGKGSQRPTSSTSTSSVARTTSNSSITSAQSTSDAENEGDAAHVVGRAAYGSPRKSQGYQRLQKASYVSQSPFRRGGGHEGDGADDEDTRPLQLPNNAWAKSAAAAAAAAEQAPYKKRPSTPERTPERTATAHAGGEFSFGTPNSQGTPRRPGNAGVDSPAGRGLLVSNRLHGPRQMSYGSGTNSPADSSTKRERRKTVTFDEVLDVQEFDRESSFDRESMRSASTESTNSLRRDGSSEHVDSDSEEMWLRDGDDSAQKVVERLMVVNGSPSNTSPEFSTPELSRKQRPQGQSSKVASEHEGDTSSADSRDEPQSPLTEEASFERGDEKSFNTALDASTYQDSAYVDPESDVSGGNVSAYGALHRVESLVDELLGDELLGESAQQRKTPAHEPAKDGSASPPRRRRIAGPTVNASEVAGAKPLPAAPAQSRSPGTGSQMESSNDMRLTLPEWSPLIKDGEGDVLQQRTSPRVTEPHSTANTTRPAAQEVKPTSGRPHISRDAVLQRVAREKQLQQERESQSSSAPGAATTAVPRVPSSTQANNATTGRRSEPDHGRTPSGPMIEQHVQPSAAEIAHQQPVNMTSAAKPVRQETSSEQRSPLERLSSVVAAEQVQAADANNATSSPTQSEEQAESDMTMTTRRQQTWFGGSSVDGSVISEGGRSQYTDRSPPFATRPLSPLQQQPSLTPAQQAEQIIARRRSKNGRSAATPSGHPPKARRSLSDGSIDKTAMEHSHHHQEMRDLESERQEEDARIAADSREEELLRQKHMLDASLKVAVDSGFETGLEREISRIYRQGDLKYRVNDRGTYASAADERISHSKQAGDVDNGSKAWRKLRRPSDMNEYAKEMREYRANENPKKASGKVFVLVDSFTPTALPVPSKPTRFYCVLDNGLHVVRTATAGLRPDVPSKIGQEFELIQHKNLEFSLTLVAQRDAHLHEPVGDQSPNGGKRITPSFSRGMGKLFSSPKKKSPFSSSGSSMIDGNAGPSTEPMIAFMNREGAFGQCNVVFEKVAHDCLARCLVVDLPVRGVSDPPASSLSSATGGMQRAMNAATDFSRNLGRMRGTLRIKIFYLPPIPGVAKNLLPDNLNDCIKGMEAAHWHSGQPWKEGTLTQLGGDCKTWRRRPVKLQGSHLIGYNEITKKPTVKIDLSKAVSIEENSNPVNKGDARRMDVDDEELDETYHVERSFRLTFKDGERIFFFADTDDEVRQWMGAMGKIVGNAKLPPQCLWAQMALEVIRSSSTSKQATTSHASGVAQPAPEQSVANAPQSHQKRAATSPAPGVTSTSSPRKRVPVPSALVDATSESSLSQPSHGTPAGNRVRPTSMLLPPPQLSSVQESSTPENTPTKPTTDAAAHPMPQLHQRSAHPAPGAAMMQPQPQPQPQLARQGPMPPRPASHLPSPQRARPAPASSAERPVSVYIDGRP